MAMRGKLFIPFRRIIPDSRDIGYLYERLYKICYIKYGKGSSTIVRHSVG